MTSKDSKRSARDQLAEQRQQQASADKRRQRTLNIVLAVVVVAAVIGIFVAVQASRNSGPADAALPKGVANAGDGATFGDGPVTVEMWVDFQCPACKAFESVNAKSLAKRVDDGDITLVIHPLSFLDRNLSNNSSKPAAAAFGCAIDAGKGLEFATKLYEVQPEENPGHEAWTIDDLIGYGNDVGITGSAWESCVTDQKYAGWAEQVAASQTDAGISSTPTVLVDGKPAWTSADPASVTDPFFTSPDALNALIDKAAQG